MAITFLAAVIVVFLVLTFVAWRRYIWVAEESARSPVDACPYSLTDVFGERHLANVPHQEGALWLSDIFSRSAEKFPDHTALQIPHTGEALTFSELDARAEDIAAALSTYLTGPDQIVAVAMEQDNWQIVAAHLGVLRAGGTLMFLDSTLPDAQISHMLNDARPVVVLTRGRQDYRGLPTLDVLALPERPPRRETPAWMEDPSERLATIFYTSGTTGRPKGVESPHAGYVNLALSYADYFDLVPGVDATSLTSSLGYDGSISEMYSAWVSGCAVVMLTKEQIRSGPDLVPVLREAEVTVLFCPPVLLTTLTPAPEFDLPYPLCRYIVPAGEAFPAALVEPWTRGRRQIINTYGPTEASTDTSRQSLRPGEPVTIGSPFANVTYVILEIGGLEPVPHGGEGELCIGGVHVARGYRNLPEETEAKFIRHPEFGRLYRTGDKCSIDGKTQRVHFLGRVDTQLKVRGHRVEAQAVEDILQTQFNEIEAAVVDYQNEALVAFVAAPSVSETEISEVASAPAAWAAQVTARLAAQLPAPSVPSKIFLVEGFVMKPVSGKIDRDRLPKLSVLSSDAETPAGSAADGALAVEDRGPAPSEDIVEIPPGGEEVLEICRAVLGSAVGWDQDFIDAGGHSIAIARLAQRLQAAGWAVPVRALLSECNTARKVASRPRQRVQAAEASTATAVVGDRISGRDEAAAKVLSVVSFTTLQALFTVVLMLPGLVLFFAVFNFVEVQALFAGAGLWLFLAVGFGLYVIGLILPFGTLLWVMAIKLMMGGHAYRNNVTPGVYPKWSKMHLRVWCIGRMETAVLFSLGAMYRSAPLLAFALRQLGASVGSNLQCAHDAYLSGPLDLLNIEDDVAIQTGAYIQTTRWSGQDLHVGPIRLESGCKIGMRAAVASNVTVGRGSWVTPFTPIVADVGPEQMWEGAPARSSGGYRRLERSAAACRYSYPIWVLESLNVLMQIALFCVLSLFPATAIFWFARNLIPLGEAGLSESYFSVTPLFEIVAHLGLYAFLSSWMSIVVTSVLGCVFIRLTATGPGLYPSRGLKAALLIYRTKKMNAIQSIWTWTITGQYLRALAGLHFPRSGGSECDIMFNLVPEQASADSQVFWSNGCFTNMLDYGAEYTTLRQLDMPRNFFAGNNCVAEYGHLPANFMLGVSTPANDIAFRRQMRSRLGEPITIAGNPPVKFASASFEEENARHRRPGFSLFLVRVLLNDFFSIGLLRVAEGLVFAVLYVCFMRYGGSPVLSAIAALFLAEGALLFASVAIKKSLIGDEWGIDHSTPFWSWRHFAYFFAQDCFFIWCRAPLGFAAGTVMANPILRSMGCRVGERTLVTEPMQTSDWNAVSFGSDCVISGFLQFHSFENMTLKVKQARIEDGCAVNFGATVMGGAMINRDTTLMPLSLILKEMSLLTGTYEGSPAELARIAASAPCRSSNPDGRERRS